MRMFIPEIGTRIILSRDWKFTLYQEYRNESVWDKLSKADPDTFDEIEERGRAEMEKWQTMRNLPYAGSQEAQEKQTAQIKEQFDIWQNTTQIDVTLPAETVLTVDRIYIRKGVSAYSSLSFNLNKTTHPALNIKGRKRFWAKLDDVNGIHFEIPGN